MLQFTLRRMLSLIPILCGISILTFLLMELAPGDPAANYLRLSRIPPSEKALAKVREEMGLNQPPHVRYLIWMKKAIRLDFGKSFTTGEPVQKEIAHYLPATLYLTGVSFIWIVVFSLPFGVMAALAKNGWIDNLCRLLAFTGTSIPNYLLGFILIYFFAVLLGWLPPLGKGGFQYVLMPSMALAVGHIAAYMRLIRAGMLDNMNQRFVTYALARGLSPRFVMGRHVLKNSLLPPITGLGMTVGNLIVGSVLIETVFAWPGLSRFFTTAIFNRDYPVIQGYVLLTAVIFVFCNLMVDLTYAWIDPRIRLGSPTT